MIKIFCNEGQKEASIIIEGVEYKTFHPPLRVFSGSGFLTRFFFQKDNNSNQQDIISYFSENDNASTNINYLSEDGNQIYELQIYANGDLVKSTRIIITSENDFVKSEENGYVDSFFQVSDELSLIYQLFSIPPYEIKCDGCGVGECKATTSKYPGHVCMNCLKMQNSVNRMIDKLR